MESETLNLTQEFLAQMLGTQRSTVTVAAGEMQRAGMIGYSRGKIQILDRPKLEAVACECYGIVRSSYERILGAFSGRNPGMCCRNDRPSWGSLSPRIFRKVFKIWKIGPDFSWRMELKS